MVRTEIEFNIQAVSAVTRSPVIFASQPDLSGALQELSQTVQHTRLQTLTRSVAASFDIKRGTQLAARSECLENGSVQCIGLIETKDAAPMVSYIFLLLCFVASGPYHPTQSDSRI